LAAVALLIAAAPLRGEEALDIRPGDVVLQKLDTIQTRALIAATGSEWTHCGLVAERGGSLVVQEALLKMAETPLDMWIARGGGKVVVTRLKEADRLITPEALAAMRAEFGKLRDRRYDFLFQWSDDKIYCSELVQKVYERALGIALAPLRRTGDYDLSDPSVQKLIRERFPGGAVDPDEPAVAPGDFLQSPLLFRAL
jgi:cell wall-associated NlpC family hydrolase